jgi:lipoprotein-releasing system ATP-binding protein
MLKAEGIKKSYGAVHVLKGVDLQVSRGEVVAIVGPSGAGKSTLLHILGTLDTPDSGQVLLNAENVFKKNATDLAKFRNTHIGFVFQFHNLLPEFSALENIMMPGLIARKNTIEVKNKAAELANMLGLGSRVNHKPSELSGGEQQRAAVARALINSPQIILADEPSGNLDSKTALELHNLFFQLRKELNQTFVIVTHNMELAHMADRRIEMADGQVKR